MLAAYSAAEQMIGRHIIESVAENLDLLPKRDSLNISESSTENKGSAMRQGTRQEMWDGQERTEAVKPRVFRTDLNERHEGNAPYSNGHSHNGNGNSNGNGRPYTNGNGNGGSYTNGNGNNGVDTNGYINGHTMIFEDLDDDISLELDSFDRSSARPRPPRRTAASTRAGV